MKYFVVFLSLIVFPLIDISQQTTEIKMTSEFKSDCEKEMQEITPEKTTLVLSKDSHCKVSPEYVHLLKIPVGDLLVP